MPKDAHALSEAIPWQELTPRLWLPLAAARVVSAQSLEVEKGMVVGQREVFGARRGQEDSVDCGDVV